VAEAVEQLAARVGLVDELDSERCAAEAREPFGPAHTAREYLKV
jgi:hypothetical protein